MVWQVLVEVGEGVRVRGEGMVLLAEAVAGCDLAETFEVDNVECT